MKRCPRCNSEMLCGENGWLCMNNMTCGQPPMYRGNAPITLSRGGIPTREQFQELRRVLEDGHSKPRQ